jgi:hypothetical protein
MRGAILYSLTTVVVIDALIAISDDVLIAWYMMCLLDMFVTDVASQ